MAKLVKQLDQPTMPAPEPVQKQPVVKKPLKQQLLEAYPIITKIAAGWQKYAAALKTDRKVQMLTLGVMIVIGVGIGGWLTKSREEVGYRQPEYEQPSPQPERQTRFVDHPTVAEAEDVVTKMESTLRETKISDHPLLPPVVDTQVTLSK